MFSDPRVEGDGGSALSDLDAPIFSHIKSTEGITPASDVCSPKPQAPVARHGFQVTCVDPSARGNLLKHTDGVSLSPEFPSGRRDLNVANQRLQLRAFHHNESARIAVETFHCYAIPTSDLAPILVSLVGEAFRFQAAMNMTPPTTPEDAIRINSELVPWSALPANPWRPRRTILTPQLATQACIDIRGILQLENGAMYHHTRLELQRLALWLPAS